MTPHANAVAGAAIDLAHAIIMVLYFLGLPLLFIHRWPRLSSVYAIFAIAFATLSLGSRLLFGHCFLTYFAGYFWERSQWPHESQEWLTVRLAMRIFRFAPTHHAVSLAADLAIIVTAVGVVWFYGVRGRAGGGGPVRALRWSHCERPMSSR